MLSVTSAALGITPPHQQCSLQFDPGFTCIRRALLLLEPPGRPEPLAGEPLTTWGLESSCHAFTGDCGWPLSACLEEQGHTHLVAASLPLPSHVHSARLGRVALVARGAASPVHIAARGAGPVFGRKQPCSGGGLMSTMVCRVLETCERKLAVVGKLLSAGTC